MSVYKFKIKLSQTGQLQVEEENFHPKVDIYKAGRKQLIILGSPIYRDKINNNQISKELLEQGLDRSLILQFDGSFLLILYDEDRFTLSIVNDRFASIPFYYWFDKKEFIGSVNYTDMWNELSGSRDFTVNKEAFYEFIHLQRLLGDKTYDEKTKYLNSATILTFDAKTNNLKTEKYWRPNFTKKYRSTKEASHILAELVSKSIIKRTSDEKDYGLLLSGGLDSRLVLAGLQMPVECITIALYENNEYAVAKELAHAKGYHHNLVKRRDAHYADILEDAVFLGGAANVYDHAHFLKLDEELSAKANVFFHGHGFDYMFGGKYLPYANIGIGGRKTYIKRLLDVAEADIKNKFLSKISYRLKSVDPLSLVIDKERNRIKESIYYSVEKVLKEGKDCCNDAYDLWEYLIIHNLSRHYTFLNVDGIRTIAEERTAAFDNQLFDFYLSIPIKNRLSKKIFVDAIKLLNTELYEIRNANTNFSIYNSDFALTGKLCVNKALKKLGFKVLLPPNQKERSWPLRADIILENKKIEEAAVQLPNSQPLDGLGFLNMDKIKLYIKKHLQGRGDYSDLILTLITIDTFMKKKLP